MADGPAATSDALGASFTGREDGQGGSVRRTSSADSAKSEVRFAESENEGSRGNRSSLEVRELSQESTEGMRRQRSATLPPQVTVTRAASLKKSHRASKDDSELGLARPEAAARSGASPTPEQQAAIAAAHSGQPPAAMRTKLASFGINLKKLRDSIFVNPKKDLGVPSADDNSTSPAARTKTVRQRSPSPSPTASAMAASNDDAQAQPSSTQPAAPTSQPQSQSPLKESEEAPSKTVISQQPSNSQLSKKGQAAARDDKAEDAARDKKGPEQTSPRNSRPPAEQQVSGLKKKGAKPTTPQANAFEVALKETVPSSAVAHALGEYKEKNWRQCYAPDAIAALSREGEKLSDHVWEVFTSEIAYLEYLLIVVEGFQKPLRELKARGFLSDVSESLLFGNLGDVLAVNDAIVRAMLARVLQAQGAPLSPFTAQHVIDCYGDFERTFACYRDYATAMAESRAYLEQMGKTSDEFAAFVKYCESKPVCRRLDLKGLLFAPVQRLTKYPLFFSDIAKRVAGATPDSPTRADVERLRDSSQVFLSRINTTIRERESLARLRSIDASMVWVRDPMAPDEIPQDIKLSLPGRLMLHEGRLFKAGAIMLSERYVFLFSDALLVTKPRKEILGKAQYVANKPPIPIADVRITDVSDEEGLRNAFVVLHVDANGNNLQGFTFQAPSAHDKAVWLETILSASTSASEAAPRHEEPAPQQMLVKVFVPISPDLNVMMTVCVTPQSPLSEIVATVCRIKNLNPDDFELYLPASDSTEADLSVPPTRGGKDKKGTVRGGRHHHGTGRGGRRDDGGKGAADTSEMFRRLSVNDDSASSASEGDGNASMPLDLTLTVDSVRPTLLRMHRKRTSGIAPTSLSSLPPVEEMPAAAADAPQKGAGLTIDTTAQPKADYAAMEPPKSPGAAKVVGQIVTTADASKTPEVIALLAEVADLQEQLRRATSEANLGRLRSSLMRRATSQRLSSGDEGRRPSLAVLQPEWQSHLEDLHAKVERERQMAGTAESPPVTPTADAPPTMDHAPRPRARSSLPTVNLGEISERDELHSSSPPRDTRIVRRTSGGHSLLGEDDPVALVARLRSACMRRAGESESLMPREVAEALRVIERHYRSESTA